MLALPALAQAQDAPVARNAAPPLVESQPLDLPGVGAAGLLTPRMTGLPISLWENSEPDTLAALIGAVDATLPAARALMRVLMLT